MSFSLFSPIFFILSLFISSLLLLISLSLFFYYLTLSLFLPVCFSLYSLLISLSSSHISFSSFLPSYLSLVRLRFCFFQSGNNKSIATKNFCFLISSDSDKSKLCIVPLKYILIPGWLEEFYRVFPSSVMFSVKTHSCLLDPEQVRTLGVVVVNEYEIPFGSEHSPTLI